MNPDNKDQFFQPSSPPGPAVPPSPTPVQPFQQPVTQPPNAEKNRKLILIGAIAGGVVLLIIIIIVVVASQNKPAPTNTTDQNKVDNTSLEPAQAIDIETVNNSINQDFSGLNDDKQLPPTALDDKTLGL